MTAHCPKCGTECQVFLNMLDCRELDARALRRALERIRAIPVERLAKAILRYICPRLVPREDEVPEWLGEAEAVRAELLRAVSEEET